MSISEQKWAFLDCFKILDDASEAKLGYRILLPGYNEAVNLRMRLHQARKIDRRESRKTYKPEDPQWGNSVYDKLIIRMREIDGEWWLYIEKRANEILAAEEITERAPRLEHKPRLQIEHTPQAVSYEPIKMLPAPIIRRRLG